MPERPFLVIKADTHITATIEESSPQYELSHYTGAGSMLCDGESCLRCLAGEKPRQRYTFDVRAGGLPWKWAFGVTVLRDLLALSPEQEDWKGVRLIISRRGATRDDTVYELSRVNHSVSPLLNKRPK